MTRPYMVHLDVLQVFVGRLETGNTVNIKQFSGKYFEKSS